MSVRSWCVGIAVAGVLLVGLAAGFVRTLDGAPPSLGGTVEVSRSPATGAGGAGAGGTGAGGAGSSPVPGASPPATSSTNTGGPGAQGGRAVSPPQVEPGDDNDDDGLHGDDDADDG